MRALESLVLALVFAALIVRYFRLPVSESLLSIAFLAAAAFYLFLGFAVFNRIALPSLFQAEAYRDSNALTIVAGALLGLAFALIFTGALFRLQLRSGAGPLLLAGILLAGSIFAVSAFGRNDDLSRFHTSIRQRTIGMVGMGAILYFLM